MDINLEVNVVNCMWWNFERLCRKIIFVSDLNINLVGECLVRSWNDSAIKSSLFVQKICLPYLTAQKKFKFLTASLFWIFKKNWLNSNFDG